MRIKVISDGNIEGTKVIDADTGKDIEFVQSVDLRIEAGAGPVKATLVVFPVELDVTAEAEIIER